MARHLGDWCRELASSSSELVSPVEKYPLIWETPVMAKPLLSDELWEVLEPLLPQWAPSYKGGRPRLGDREASSVILFILKTDRPGRTCRAR